MLNKDFQVQKQIATKWDISYSESVKKLTGEERSQPIVHEDPPSPPFFKVPILVSAIFKR